MKKTSYMFAAALSLVASTASAQIIVTSIPKVAATSSAMFKPEKTFAIHVMGSPMSKWKYNELAGGPIGSSNSLFDVGLFSGTPNSDFLFAGESVFKVGRDFSIGVGGWHNKVGKVRYGFAVATIDTDFGQLVDTAAGTLDGDLTLSEGHASVFYKNVGVQAGIVHTNSKLTSSKILSSAYIPSIVGLPLGSIEQDNSANDWDLYGVYKYGGSNAKLPFGVSVGGGMYGKQGTTESAQRSADNQVVFSSFVNGSVDLYKGFGLDVSYWYIAKTKADFLGAPLVSDATSRFTFGFGYSFSK